MANSPTFPLDECRCDSYFDSRVRTLAPGSTKDSDAPHGLLEKISKNTALDAEIKSRRSFGDRWREFGSLVVTTPATRNRVDGTDRVLPTCLPPRDQVPIVNSRSFSPT